MTGSAPLGRVAYLGPPGTFTEAALHRLAGGAEVDAVPTGSVGEALDAARNGDVDAALVPLENSLEGSVAGTLDDLADLTAHRLVIAAEVLLPVSFALLTRPGTALSDVTSVTTIPAAEAQCRPYLRRDLPAAVVVPASSTAEAARAVATGTTGAQAAIASVFAGRRYGLVPLAEGLETAGGKASPVTRFVLVRRPAAPAPPTGADRTTVVLFEGTDRPGSLVEILTEFAVRGVNMTRLESRPTGEGLGSYCFAIDLEGHIAEPRTGEALAAVQRICSEVLFLGSYPRGDGKPSSPPRPGTAPADFAGSADWLARLRTGG